MKTPKVVVPQAAQPAQAKPAPAPKPEIVYKGSAFLATLQGIRGLWLSQEDGGSFIPLQQGKGGAQEQADGLKLKIVPRSSAQIQAKLAYEAAWRIEHGRKLSPEAKAQKASLRASAQAAIKLPKPLPSKPAPLQSEGVAEARKAKGKGSIFA